MRVSDLKEHTVHNRRRLRRGRYKKWIHVKAKLLANFRWVDLLCLLSRFVFVLGISNIEIVIERPSRCVD